MDYFLEDKNCEHRLITEWENYGQLIIAVDFDNTLYDYYQKGYTFDNVINQIKELKQMGCHIIIFTSCDESRFPMIKEYLRTIDLKYDSINETPDFIPFKGRKVYYNVLYDDRAGLSSVYNMMKNVIQMRKINLHLKKMSLQQDIEF